LIFSNAEVTPTFRSHPACPLAKLNQIPFCYPVPRTRP